MTCKSESSDWGGHLETAPSKSISIYILYLGRGKHSYFILHSCKGEIARNCTSSRVGKALSSTNKFYDTKRTLSSQFPNYCFSSYHHCSFTLLSPSENFLLEKRKKEPPFKPANPFKNLNTNSVCSTLHWVFATSCFSSFQF